MADADLQLLDAWCVGDEAAGNALFKRHFVAVYRFFEHKTESEVDDLVQETFLQCLKSRETFKRQSTFRTYLFAIARHVLFGYWRKRMPRDAGVPVDEISIASLSTSVGTRLADREDRVRLLEAMRTLPMDQQVLLEMYYWQDLDREELAEIFDVETATIGSRLFRARQTLVERLASANLGTPDALDTWVRAIRPHE